MRPGTKARCGTSWRRIWAATRLPPQQLRQLANVGRDPPGLIFAQQLRCRLAPRLILKIDIGERLAVVIANNEAGVVRFIERPRRREAAGGGHVLSQPRSRDRTTLKGELSARNSSRPLLRYRKLASYRPEPVVRFLLS